MKKQTNEQEIREEVKKEFLKMINNFKKYTPKTSEIMEKRIDGEWIDWKELKQRLEEK